MNWDNYLNCCVDAFTATGDYIEELFMPWYDSANELEFEEEDIYDAEPQILSGIRVL